MQKEKSIMKMVLFFVNRTVLIGTLRLMSCVSILHTHSQAMLALPAPKGKTDSPEIRTCTHSNTAYYL